MHPYARLAGNAWQWSYYAARLRSAAALAPSGDVQFGGYIIGRESAGPGLAQKMLAVIGAGGKALRVYTFGPEYMFPGNSWSDHTGLYANMTRALDIIGAAEDVLVTGTRLGAQIAIVYPRSSLVFDEWGVARPTTVADETNTNMDAHTVDYMAEVHGLFDLLTAANLPVDFLDEDSLIDTPSKLQTFRIVFVTEPNLPAQALDALQAYVSPFFLIRKL